MNSMMITIIIVMAVYFVAMIAISWMGKKYATNFSDYLSAGHSAGIALIVGGAMGAHLGNGLVVGGGSEGAAVGLSGAVYGLGCCLSYVFLAFLLNKFVYQNGYLSLADFLRKRYDNELPAQVYNIVTVLSYLGILGSQLMAGKALFEAMGMNGVVGVFIIAIVVFLYSQISGLWGAFATSVIQSAVIAVGILAAVIYLFQDNAWGLIQEAVAAGTVPETYTSIYKGYDLTTILMLVIPVSLMIFTDQCSYQRICSAKSERTSFAAHLLAAAFMVPICIAPAVIGMYGYVKFGATGNSAFFTVVLNVLPPIFAALVVTAVIAAVMSTIDGAFIAFSQVLLNDLYRNHINKSVTEERLSKMTLGLNIIITAIGIVIALTATSLVGLLSNTYLFLTAACLVPFLGGRIWKGGTTAGAVTSSAVGVVFCLLQMAGIYTLPYSAVTLFIPSLVAYVVVSLCTGKKGTTVQ